MAPRSVAVTAAVALMLLLLEGVSSKHKASQEFRLPHAVWPVRYDLRLTTSVCEDNPTFFFDGQVAITVHVRESTSVIKLNSKDLNVSLSDTTLTKVGEKKNISIKSQELDKEREFYIAKLHSKLCANCSYVLTIKYNGLLSTKLTGYYRSSYTDAQTGDDKWVAVTQFQATEARRAFPCFDEPEFKAVFKISLGHHRKCKAVSNMPLIKCHNVPEHPDWVIDEFDESVRMSTYLVAWSLSEFKCIKASGGVIRVCAREDALAQTKLALKVGPMSLQYFEKYFELKYPLPKSDNLAIPDFNAGAMENWGLITYRETYLLADDLATTLKAKHFIASIVSHELAHQWFGNLVTLKWWGDLWLNEGFATFVAALGVHHDFPEWNSRIVEAVEEFISVYTLDALKSSHPISANINHPKEISQMFDIISYKKGSLLLRMISLFLGEEVFRKGVVNYLKEFKFRNAGKDDLYKFLTDEARRKNALPQELNIKMIVDTWTLQTGYPIVTIRKDKGDLVFTQKRFVFEKDPSPSKSENPCWMIPLTFTTASVRDFNNTAPQAWMTCKEPELRIPNPIKENEWIIANIQSSGIYRVTYDAENWELISDTLNSRHYKSIHVMNRMQIVNDVMHLSWSNELDINTAKEVISYLRREHEFLPWRVAFQNFDKINKIFMRTSGYSVFLRWLRRLMKPSYERLGNPDPDDFHRLRHQEQLYNWACNVQIESCLHQTRTLYAQWMGTNDPTRNDVIPTDLRHVVICMAMKYGGEKEWNFAWEYYLSLNIVNVKVEILKSLGCSGEPWILRRYLTMLLENEGVRKQDGPVVFASVVKSEVGYHVANEFMLNKTPDLFKLYGPRNTYFGKFIKGWADMMFTPQELQQFTDWAEKNKEYLEGSEMAISQAKEDINNKIQWYNDHYEKFLNAIQTVNRNGRY